MAAIKTYADFRKMFDECGKNIDAVFIAIPDHNHAAVAMMAIKMGKHVYCEKPLTHDIWEARALGQAAKQYKVQTQMGNQGHCGDGYRRLVEYIRAGAIGTVKEVHTWCDNSICPCGGTGCVEQYASASALWASLAYHMTDRYWVPSSGPWKFSCVGSWAMLK